MNSQKNNNARISCHRGRDNRNNNKKKGEMSLNSNIYNTLIFNAKRFPLPENFRTTLVYYEQVNFSAVTTPQLYIFRGNSPFDPDQTGTGAQPVGFDNLATFYVYGSVIGSRISISAYNLTTGVLQLAVLPTLTSTYVSTYEQLRYVGSNARFLDLDGTSRGGTSFGTLTHTGVSTKVIGRPWDSDFITPMGSNPTLQWYWTIAMQTADQATAISCALQITVEYDCLYSSPKAVALS